MLPKTKKAWEILAEITDLLDKVNDWADTKADATINKLADKWQKLCLQTSSARSREFCNQCEKILEECDSFRTDIVSETRKFTKKVQNRLLSINELAGDNKETQSLLKQILEIWNKVEQPRLVFLYEKTVELESRIRDMVEFAMAPIEVTN